MWTVVYIVPHVSEAERIREVLLLEGFLVKLKFIGMSETLESGPVEILVPESEVEEAMEIINNM